VAALWSGGGVAVVARSRSTGALAFARTHDEGGELTAMVSLPVSLDDIELVGAWPNLGLLGRPTNDGGAGRVLLRLGETIEAGSAAPVIVGAAVCATAEGVYSIARDVSGWKTAFYPLADGGAETTGGVLPNRAEATVVCGQHRAFFVARGAGELRALAWSHSAERNPPALLPAPTSEGASDETLMTAMDDELVIVKLDGSIIESLVWSGQGVPGWRKSSALAQEGLSLEALEGQNGEIGLLFLRTIAKAKGCPAGDATDAVAEVAIVEARSGKLVHAPEPVETWRCGSEPGPFFTGWAGGRFIVAWPRGADATCTRAGVRRGGIGFASVDPKSGRATVGRISRPAETIADAGCDDARCYAVALTRGSDPCASDGPESGRVEVIAYPP
jgi:hypothetical protein